MDKSQFWWIVVLLGMGTLTIRASFFFLYSKLKIPKTLERTFAYIPAAVLPALVVPSVAFHQGQVTLLGGHERVVALIIATLISFYTKSVTLTVLLGLGILFAINQTL